MGTREGNREENKGGKHGRETGGGNKEGDGSGSGMERFSHYVQSLTAVGVSPKAASANMLRFAKTPSHFR